MKVRKKMILALGAIFALGMGVVKTARAQTADLRLSVSFSGSLSVEVDGSSAPAISVVGLQAYSAAGTPAGNPGSNDFAAPITSDTVINAGSITEKWELDASTVAGLGNWTLTDATGTSSGNPSGGYEKCLSSCPGANQYAIQALFVSSMTSAGPYGDTTGTPCPDLLAVDWNGYVSTVPAHSGFPSLAVNPLEDFAVYTSTEFADPALILSASGYPDSNISSLSLPNPGDMLPYAGAAGPGTGRRGLCVRVTMPSSASTTLPQIIQLEITAIPG
jgi:hypothetical protein